MLLQQEGLENFGKRRSRSFFDTKLASKDGLEENGVHLDRTQNLLKPIWQNSDVKVTDL